MCTVSPTVLYWLLCCVYDSKFAILRGKLPVISGFFAQTLKTLKNWTSLKQSGLNAHFATSPSKIEDPPTQDKVSACDNV